MNKTASTANAMRENYGLSHHTRVVNVFAPCLVIASL